MIRAIPLLAALALATACGFDTRSGAYACEGTGTSTCTDGRVCENGWCVVPGAVTDGGPSIDADPGAPPDADNCPAECSSCVGGVCVISCGSGNSCFDTVVCPAGLPCRVECGGNSSCAGGVDCELATSCEVVCGGRTSCAGQIHCGTGACDVECNARETCLGGVDCTDSCSCDVACAGINSCATPADCPSLDCELNDGCSAALDPDCDTCQ